jgi:hypothetical protein
LVCSFQSFFDLEISASWSATHQFQTLAPLVASGSSGGSSSSSSGYRWRHQGEAFLDDLQQTLDKFAVPQAEQAENKAIVASTRADIVV